MILLDWTLPTPEQNLAADEALLDWCERREGVEVLRFWEAARPFVVVGYANSVTTEVNVGACEARGVPILRRCTGGGTVAQGPGCLNYALILRINPHGPTRNVSATNQFVMGQNAAALNSSFQTCASKIEVRGHTDLVLGGFKFSGNAQRRRRQCLLFHGTFLLGLDLALVEALLPMPSRQPEYRQGRAHCDFIRNLTLSARTVKEALEKAWKAERSRLDLPMDAVEGLVREKYGRREWTHRSAA